MKTTVQIGGMHCASCSSLIEKWLKKLDGIETVSVSLATNAATIKYNEQQVPFNTIVQQIEKLWYSVTEQNYSHEMQHYWTRFVWSALCTLPIATMMFVHWWPLVGDNLVVLQAVFLILTAINVLILWGDFHDGAIKKAKLWQTNMDTLISIGTSVALWYSLYAFVMTYYLDRPTEMGDFLMGASFIITFILLGKYFETKSKGNASQAIQKLLQLQEKEALVLRDGKEVKIAIDKIVLQDTVIVRAGDKIPVDGTISQGKSDIDEAMLTGESIPVSKQPGDEVYTGTMVINGNLHITVTKTSDETMLAKIISVVNDAQANKPPIQHLVDKIASAFVWIVLLIAAGTLIVRHLRTGDRWDAILHMIAVIVIACPCAMWLATPVAIMVASGKGAAEGILIKSWATLEKSQKIDAVVFDKTWTLTTGKPQVTDVISLKGTASQILDLAVSLSRQSHHPLSQAVVAHTNNQNYLDLVDFQEISGHGLVAKLMVNAGKKQKVMIGNKKLLEAKDIDIDDATLAQVSELQSAGKTVNYVVQWKHILWLIALLDLPKPDAATTVAGLSNMGIEVIMISGDTEKTVAAIAGQIGIKTFYAEVLPEKKAKIVKKLQKKGKFVAFVWDGINDAPALAQSNLGIGMWQGSDIAVETAEIVLVHGNPSKVLESIRLSRKTYAIIKQNLFWAFAYNAILIPVAALGLLVPMYASLAMSLSSVSVVLNSLRIKK